MRESGLPEFPEERKPGLLKDPRDGKFLEERKREQRPSDSSKSHKFGEFLERGNRSPSALSQEVPCKEETIDSISVRNILGSESSSKEKSPQVLRGKNKNLFHLG